MEESTKANGVNNLADLNTKIEQIVKLKTEGNSIFKSDVSTAIDLYEKAKEKINEVEKGIKEDLTELGENNEDVKKLKENLRKESVLVHSNLALSYFKNDNFEKSVEHDLKVVTGLDTNFDKSYARLVQTYTKLDKLDNAVYYYLMMNRIFTPDTVNKYTDIFNALKADNPKFAEHLKKMTAPPEQKGKNYTFMVTMLVLGVAYFLYKYYMSRSIPEEPEF